MNQKHDDINTCSYTLKNKVILSSGLIYFYKSANAILKRIKTTLPRIAVIYIVDFQNTIKFQTAYSLRK